MLVSGLQTRGCLSWYLTRKIYAVAGSVFWKNIPHCRRKVVFQKCRPGKGTSMPDVSSRKTDPRQKFHPGNGTPLSEKFSGRMDPAIGTVFWDSTPLYRKCLPIWGLLSRMCSPGKVGFPEATSGKGVPFVGSALLSAKGSPFPEVFSRNRDLFSRSVIREREPIYRKCFSRKRTHPLPEVSSAKRDFFTKSVFQESRPLRRKSHPRKRTPLPEVFSGKRDLVAVSVFHESRPLCHKCSPGKKISMLDVFSGKEDPFAGSVFQERGP